LPHLLAIGAAFHLEVPSFRLPTIVGKSQKGKLLWLLASFARIPACKTPKLHTAGLLLRQFQPKLPNTMVQPEQIAFCFFLVLKARHEIVGKTIEIRLTSTPLLNYFTEPLVQQSG
jgi:hypothetical protein